MGHWLTDKDILCWLTQELVHMEINETCTWTLAVTYIKRVSWWMQIVDSGSTLDNMALCNHKEVLHWFVCAFDCRVRLEHFIIWVWEPLSSIHLIRPFLVALKKRGVTTKNRALGFQKDGWSWSLHLTKLVVDHRGSFSDAPLTPMDPSFVNYVLSIVNADRTMQVIEPLGDDLDGQSRHIGGHPSQGPHPWRVAQGTG